MKHKKILILIVLVLKTLYTLGYANAQHTWYPEEIDIGIALDKIIVADADNDGLLEIYGKDITGIYRLKYNGSDWEQTVINSSYVIADIAVGDGNEDGANELYIACYDGHIYQFKWNGSSWKQTDVGLAANDYYMYSVAVGDGNNDGKLEIYGTAGYSANGSVYQFKWNGVGWDRIEIASSSSSFFENVEVGDGNNDGFAEVYVTCNKWLYQLKFAGSWNKTTVEQTHYAIETRISDADNNGTLEVYCVCGDKHIYQFMWNGVSWVETDMGANDNYFNGLEGGDGNNDGMTEVYTANGDNSISQFKWNGSLWLKTDIFNSAYSFKDVAVGDADEDGQIDIYAFGGTKLVKITTQTDAGAPEVVGDLVASPSPAPGEVYLTWTARGDDGDIGNNSEGGYIVKYANSPIVTEADFTAATNYPNTWVPSSKGVRENHYVGGLSPNTIYYFAIKTHDEVPYTSTIDTSTPRAVAMVKKNPFYTRTVFDDTWYSSPSGYMGENNGASMALTTVTDSPAEGTKCLKLVYDAGNESWVGFFALNNGWGGQGIDLSNYSNLVFKARVTGTNVPCTEIRYGLGESSDSCGEIRSDWIKISSSWQTYSLDLSGYDLHDVNGIFMIAVSGPSVGIPVIYLDDIKFVGWGNFALTDLTAVSGTGNGEIIVSWTTPAGAENPLSHYLVKYSANPITNQAGFEGAATFTQFWTPKAAGENDSRTISGLTPGVLYYIAIEAVDSTGAQATLSNTTGNAAVAGTNAMVSLTSILPASGTNNGYKQITMYGGGFASGVTARLVRAGYADIIGSNITMVSGSEMKAFFDLNGKHIGLWDVYVERNGKSAVLEKVFTISSPMSSPKYWVPEYIGSYSAAGESVADIALGDVDKNGSFELYGANYNHHVYQYKWDGIGWQKTDIGSGEAAMCAVAVADGNNDGAIEVYAGDTAARVYQFSWNGSSWSKQDLGLTGGYMGGMAVAVGDADNDGQREVYAGGDNGYIYRFRWTGASWEKTDIGSGAGFMRSVSIGDGNNDGQPEVYGGNNSGSIYQFKWNGAGWDKTEIGATDAGCYVYKVSIGDGDNDGSVEIFAACGDGRVYQFEWNGSGWNKTTLISVENPVYGVGIGDGNNDGQQEVYCAGSNGRIYQCAWNGVKWEEEKIDSGSDTMYAVIVGDGNNNGKLEVYGANASGFIYQFTKVTTPLTELLKEEHVYDDQWHYSPSGFMGEKNGISIIIHTGNTENPFEGKYCNQVTYDVAKEDWAGVFVQASGAWGGKGINLTGYTRLMFRARIDEENANAIQVQYGLGAAGDSASYQSSWVTLTPEWQEFIIDLTGMDLSAINGLFMFNMRKFSNVDPEIFLDDVKFVGPGPAAITDLTAARGPHGGEINLTWTVPEGGVVSYLVKYSTNVISNQVDFDQALTYNQQWLPGSAGVTETKILTGFDPGNYYYLAIESVDAQGRQSDLSNVAATLSRISGIGIVVDPGTISLGEVQCGQVITSSQSIGVTNVGGVPVTLQLGLVEPPGWKSSTETNGVNTFLLNAAFATSPESISWSIANHALSPTLVTCTGTKFAGNQTGANIPLDEIRNLWIQFIAPTQIGMGTESQEISISIMGGTP